MRAGAIDHALRFTVPRTQRGYIHPATHLASSQHRPEPPADGAAAAAEGAYDRAASTARRCVILRALKRYGMLVADNGSDWYITGAPDRRWNDEDLDQLKTVPGSAFEAVRSGRIRR